MGCSRIRKLPSAPGLGQIGRSQLGKKPTFHPNLCMVAEPLLREAVQKFQDPAAREFDFRHPLCILDMTFKINESSNRRSELTQRTDAEHL